MDDLNLRAGTRNLPPSGTVGVVGEEKDVLVAVQCNENGRNTSKWRTIDLYSNEDLPWEAEVGWTGGMAGKRKAFITVARTTRVSVFASSLAVKGKSLSSLPVTAWAAIADGSTDNENEYSVRGEFIAATHTATLPVPPFAKYVRLELDTESEYPLSSIALIDGWGVTRNTTRGDRQPAPGLPVGDSQSVTITTTNSVKWRVTFILNL